MKAKFLQSNLVLAMLFIITNGYSQFNKTWYDGEAVDIVDAGNGNSMVLSMDANYAIILTHLDFNGNVLFEKGFNIVQGNPNESARSTKLLQTPSGDYIVVGIYAYSSGPQNYDYSPFAARFDPLGKMIWVHVYHSSPFPGTVSAPGYTKVNIVHVDNDPGVESYILTSPSDPHTDIGPYNFPDVVINGIRIDANGNPMWNKKFRVNDMSRATTAPYNDYFASESYPQALTFFPHGEAGGSYFIAGTNRRYFFSGGLSEEGFYMTIDKDGNIVYPFVRFDSYPFWAWNNDALYDASTQEIVLASSMPNWFGGGSSASAIAVTRFNSSLQIISHNFYHYPNATENYSMGIKEDASGNNYIIAAYVHDFPLNVSSMAILMLDKTTFSPVFYHRYNTNNFSFPTAIISHTDPFSMMENFVVVGTRTPPPPIGIPQGIRVISTDVAGNACGVDPIYALHGSFSVGSYIDPYEEIDVNGMFSPFMTQANIQLQESDCHTDPDYKSEPGGSLSDVQSGLPLNQFPVLTHNDRQATHPEGQPGLSLNLFPTLLTHSDQQVTLTVENSRSTKLTVGVYNTGGKRVSEYALELQKGLNTFELNTASIGPGIYLVRAVSDDQDILETRRLVKE